MMISHGNQYHPLRAKNNPGFVGFENVHHREQATLIHGFGGPGT
jgi:hypothetical protein